MLKATEIKAAAHALYNAEFDRVQIGLLTQKYPNIEMTDAYSIQKALVQLKIESGQKIVGWKIGLTSKAMQYALNIDIPDSGVLMDDMEFSNDSKIPSGRFIQPRIEAEIAFVMKSSLGGYVTVEDVIQATDFVCPALEILDTRILRL
ncbi:MAG: 2-oxo-hepta-3-ene-1,7-dioic acid hydratase, partial [Proteobacteria bacterium]|nr:2-oxo-hepta-3-ene-1,7-dioic acid hydratase [Pseudomonadota bacterium]